MNSRRVNVAVFLYWGHCNNSWEYFSPGCILLKDNKDTSKNDTLFCFATGATRTADAHELLYARQKVVATAKAFGMQAIDLVYIDFKGNVRWLH